MDKTITKITVCFENPFWIGIYERESNEGYEVAKVIFGSEPKDNEVYLFFLTNFKRLRFSPSIKNVSIEQKHINPKRMQRLINKQLQDTGIGTKAQNALKLMHEQSKLQHKEFSREKKEYEKQRRFEMHKAKRKEKHKGH